MCEAEFIGFGNEKEIERFRYSFESHQQCTTNGNRSPSLTRKDFHQKTSTRKVKSDISIWSEKHLRKHQQQNRRKINEFLNAFCAFSFTLKLIDNMILFGILRRS
jgi:hypothetical protein